VEFCNLDVNNDENKHVLDTNPPPVGIDCHLPLACPLVAAGANRACGVSPRLTFETAC